MLRFRALLALGCLLILNACNTVAGPENSGDLSLARAQASEYSSRMSYGAYVLRPSDQLRVQVYDDQNITGDYQIDSGGFISVPLAGRIKASGLTTAQLERAIVSKLRNGVLKNPNVSVQITGYGSIYVHGEVKRAGEFPYKPGLTIMDAVALAGGYTYRADESTAFVTNGGSNTERGYLLDRSVRVYPGDNVRIPERFF
jgi:polysaccharide export outer membrane protein